MISNVSLMKKSEKTGRTLVLRNKYFDILGYKVKNAERLKISPKRVEEIENTRLFLFYNEPDTNSDDKIDGLSAIVGMVNGKYLQVVPPIKYPINAISESKETLYTDEKFLKASKNDFDENNMGKPFIEGIILRIYLFDGEVYVSNWKNPILEMKHKLSLTNFASKKRDSTCIPSSILRILEKCFPDYKDVLFPNRARTRYSSIVYNFVLTGSLFQNKNAFITFDLFNLIYVGYSVSFGENQTALKKGEYDESVFDDSQMESFYKVCIENNFDVEGHHLMINDSFQSKEERDYYFFHGRDPYQPIHENYDIRALNNLPIFNGESYYRSKNFTIMLNILTGFFPFEGDISYRPIVLRLLKQIRFQMNEKGEVDRDVVFRSFKENFLYFDFYSGRHEEDFPSREFQFNAVDLPGRDGNDRYFSIPKRYTFPDIENNKLLDFIQFQIVLNIVHFTSKVKINIKTIDGIEVIDLSEAKFELFDLINSKIATKSSDGRIISGITVFIYDYYNNVKNLSENEMMIINSIPFKELIVNFEKAFKISALINSKNKNTQKLEYILERSLILRRIEVLLKTDSAIKWENVSKLIRRIIQIKRV